MSKNYDIEVLTSVQARFVFELYYQTVSDRTWYRINKQFDQEFPRTKSNIQLIVQVKQVFPSISLHKIACCQSLKEVKKLFENREIITGKDFKEFLLLLKFDYNKNTLSRWFKPIGGFKNDKHYNEIQLRPILNHLCVQLMKQRYRRKIENDRSSQNNSNSIV